MSNITFYVPEIKNAGAYVDDRGHYAGGYGWRGDRSLSNIKKIIVHHTVTNPSGNARKDVDYVYQIHHGSRGWGGIGYHFLITSEEKNGFAIVHEVGDIGSIRAHAINAKGLFGLPKDAGNVYFLGISIVGRFDQGAMPTQAQLRSLHYLIKELVEKEDARLPNLKSWSDVIGHKDVDYTACPGDWTKMKPLIQNFKEPSPDPVYIVKEGDKQLYKGTDQAKATDVYNKATTPGTTVKMTKDGKEVKSKTIPAIKYEIRFEEHNGETGTILWTGTNEANAKKTFETATGDGAKAGIYRLMKDDKEVEKREVFVEPVNVVQYAVELNGELKSVTAGETEEQAKSRYANLKKDAQKGLHGENALVTLISANQTVDKYGNSKQWMDLIDYYSKSYDDTIKKVEANYDEVMSNPLVKLALSISKLLKKK